MTVDQFMYTQKDNDKYFNIFVNNRYKCTVSFETFNESEAQFLYGQDDIIKTTNDTIYID